MHVLICTDRVYQNIIPCHYIVLSFQWLKFQAVQNSFVLCREVVNPLSEVIFHRVCIQEYVPSACPLLGAS